MKEAMFWEKRENGEVQCLLCPQYCQRKEGNTGFCRIRKNIDGTFFTLNYGRVSSYGMDPIEKKPLYHFYPGSYIFSIGTVGCNLRCGFCQNWEIAHGDPKTLLAEPEEIVRMARQHGGKNIGIAYTYSEPFMWYEFVYDTARAARNEGLKNVLVTNGYINEEPLAEILPYIDAMNIDVKGFTEKYYKETCVGRLEPVIRTVEKAYKECHVEITTLLVTGLNDSPEEIAELVKWIASLDENIPLHFSRYFPNFEMDLLPTPIEIMEKAKKIADEKLNYVYIGNVPGYDNNTRCPQCEKVVINRGGYTARIVGLKGNKCANCGKEIKVVL